MALLAGIGMPLAELSRQRGLEEDLRHALREIRGAIDAYKRLVDDGRIERAVDGSGYPPDLSVLVDGVKDARSPTGARLYFLRRLPRDPMAADSTVPAAATWSLRSYASPPAEPAPARMSSTSIRARHSSASTGPRTPHGRPQASGIDAQRRALHPVAGASR